MRTLNATFIAAAAGFIAGFAGQGALAQAPSGLIYDWDLPRCGASAHHMAELINDCMQRVMHPRGLEGGSTAEVSAASAAALCRRTRSHQDSRALQGCVRALMYERSGLGARREAVSGEAATLACRYASSSIQADQVEDCMKRLLFTRGGLGHARTEMSDVAAAYACQGVAAPAPIWPLQPACRPPAGEEAVRFIEQCVKSLMYTRDGLGSRREGISGELAALACEGVLSAWP